jgi:hypothetical protein
MPDVNLALADCYCFGLNGVEQVSESANSLYLKAGVVLYKLRSM